MTFSPLSIGKICALVVLILAVVFLAVGHLTMVVGGLFALLAVAILLL